MEVAAGKVKGVRERCEDVNLKGRKAIMERIIAKLKMIFVTKNDVQTVDKCL